MHHGSSGRLEELGKVYVYLQRGPLLLEPSQSHLMGKQAYGRFGTSLAPLGDLNQDGFNGTCAGPCTLSAKPDIDGLLKKFSFTRVTNFLWVCLTISRFWRHDIQYLHFLACLWADVAIGCPYGGDDQQGLVLIYNGHPGGLVDNPTQTLSGQWASSSFPANFGFALRGNTDLDLNGYPGTAELLVPFIYQHEQPSFNSLYLLPDLIVGAFGVDKAVMYRYVTLHNVTDEQIENIIVFLLIWWPCLHSGLALSWAPVRRWLCSRPCLTRRRRPASSLE